MNILNKIRHHRFSTSLARVWLVVSLCATSAAAAPDVIDFDDPPDHLPYTLEPGRHSIRGLMNWSHSNSTDAVDVDGDGVSELVTGTTPYIQIKSWSSDVLTGSEQFNLPGRFTGRDPCAWVDGAWDLDGDGVGEVIVGSRSDDGSEIRYWALDAGTHDVKLEFDLPVGIDVSGDGIWDGVYGAVGVIDVPGPDGPIKALVMICLVRYDEFGRRIFAIDVRDGSELWSLPLANCPDRSTTFIRDVDGDGTDEIVMIGNAARNLDEEDGDQVDGLRDDVVRIFGIEADGSTAWRTDLDVPCTHSSAVLDDLDGDGRLELAVATTNHLMTNAVSIFDPADGAVRAAWPARYGVQGLVAIDRPGGGKDLVFGMMNGELHRLGFDGAGFTDRLVAVYSARINVFGAFDLLSDAGDEVLMTVNPRRLIIMTSDDRWVADTTIDSGSIQRTRLMTLPSGERTLLVPRYEETGTNWNVAAVPSPPPPYAAVALTLGVLGSAVVVWRRRPGKGKGQLLSLRDRRLALLERLQLAGHGRIGALQTVRRLEVKVILVSGLDQRPPMMLERIRELFDRLGAETLPRLGATLDLAEAAEVPDHRVARARAALDDFKAMLSGGMRPDELSPSLVARLRGCSAEVEGAFMKIRDEVLIVFTASLAGTWRRVIEELDDKICDAVAAVTCTGGPEVDVCLDPEELEFIFENLLANALLSLAGAPERRVRVSWDIVDGMAVVRVADTGCGIAPDDWDRVLETRASTRVGGGIGLPRSNEILRRFGGRIRIVESAPGEGTVFEVELPESRVVRPS